MGKLFTSNPVSSPKVQTKIPPGFNTQNNLKLANILTPNTNGGLVDIINNYPWSLTPSSSISLKETPYIKLTEFYLLDSAIKQLYSAYGLQVDNLVDLTNALATTIGVPNSDSKRLYEGLYDQTNINYTGFTYKFPYFSNVRNSISNTWTEKNMYQEILTKQIFAAGAIASAGAATAEIAAAIGTGGLALIPELIAGSSIIKYTGTGAQAAYKFIAEAQQLTVGLSSPVARAVGEDPALDVPRLWSSTAQQSFNISFPLFNTLPTSDILSNWELCYLLSYQNLYNKRNLFTGIPPVFYKIEIPGVYFSKAGYVSKLSIKNIGNIHSIPLTIEGSITNVNVPDAYYIDMTVTDFFIPSKNFLDAVSSPNKVTSLLKTAPNIKPVAPASSPTVGSPENQAAAFSAALVP